jgi:hypothetical protein
LLYIVVVVVVVVVVSPYGGGFTTALQVTEGDKKGTQCLGV